MGGPPSAPSLRAQQSNPDCLRGKILDCFAALAMTRGRDSELSPAETPPHLDALSASGEREKLKHARAFGLEAEIARRHAFVRRDVAGLAAEHELAELHHIGLI